MNKREEIMSAEASTRNQALIEAAEIAKHWEAKNGLSPQIGEAIAQQILSLKKDL